VTKSDTFNRNNSNKLDQMDNPELSDIRDKQIIRPKVIHLHTYLHIHTVTYIRIYIGFNCTTFQIWSKESSRRNSPINDSTKWQT
jgi:hypothetical protein